MARQQLTIEDKHGNLVAVPSHLIVCDHCAGEGRVEHPAFSNGISSETWDEWDEEDRERYMGGAYDVRCDYCKGRGMVRVADFRACTFGQRRLVVLAERLAAQAAQDARDDWRTQCAENGWSGY